MTKKMTKDDGTRYPCVNCDFITNGDFLCPKCGGVLCESCSDEICNECVRLKEEMQDFKYFDRD